MICLKMKRRDYSYLAEVEMKTLIETTHLGHVMSKSDALRFNNWNEAVFAVGDWLKKEGFDINDYEAEEAEECTA